MSDENKNNDEVLNLVDRLDSASDRDNVDLYDDFKRTIFTFLRTRSEVVSQLETFRNQMNAGLSQKVAHNELTFDELLKLYITISDQINNASDSLVSILKPVPGTESVLAKAFKSDDEVKDAVKKFHNSLSPEMMKKLDTLRKTLDSFTRKRIEEKKSEESVDRTE